jgi:hypothetical protein
MPALSRPAAGGDDEGLRAMAEAWLDARLVDLTKPLELEVDGKASTVPLSPSLRVLCSDAGRTRRSCSWRRACVVPLR